MNLSDEKLIEALRTCSRQELAALAALFKGQVSEVAKGAIRKIRRRLKRQARRGR